MKRILVPSDLSEISENALKLASAIAAKTKAEIYLVNFMDHPFGDSFRTMGSEPDDQIDDLFTIQLLNKNHAMLGELSQKYGSDDVEINFQVYDEDFDEGVIKYIGDQNIDLVVMGTTGEETLEERFTGNNTEQVIQKAPCPVLSVKENYKDLDFTDIALGIDFDEDEEDNYRVAAMYINDLTSSLEAKLHLVHVAEPGSNNKVELESKLTEWAEKYHITGYTVSVVENKKTDLGLIYYANETDASILASFTHAKSGFFRLFTESLSEGLSKDANLPVLTINLHNI